MKIRKATKRDFNESIKIAKKLKEWFTREAVKNMKIDFSLNNLVVAVENSKVLGFLCYASNNNVMHLIWLGVSKDLQRKGVGKYLLDWLFKETKRLGVRSVEVETLPDESSYEPYKLTRAFYYKNGFKKIAYKKARVKGWDDQIVMEKVMGSKVQKPVLG